MATAGTRRRADLARPDAGTSRGPVRPAAAARSRRVPGEKDPGGSRSFRLAVLATIAIVLAVTLVPAVRALLAQQAQIADTRAEVVRQRADLVQLQQEQRKWADPAYVEQQARERLKYVKVGERAFTVLGAPRATVPGGGSAPLATTAGPEQPWYAKLWTSLAAPDPYVSSGIARPAK